MPCAHSPPSSFKALARSNGVGTVHASLGLVIEVLDSINHPHELLALQGLVNSHRHCRDRVQIHNKSTTKEGLGASYWHNHVHTFLEAGSFRAFGCVTIFATGL